MKTIFKVVVGFVIILLLSAWVIGTYLSPDDLKKCGPTPSSAKGCQKAQAIVAVSGGDTAARTDEAIKLYKNGWADTLIFSGAAADTSGPSNAKVMQARAISAGVDPNATIVEERSQTTAENASDTTTIFKDNNITSAIIVTSAYHERRAMLEFQRQAGDKVTLRAHPVATDNQWGKFWWLTPTGWSLAIPELVSSLIISMGGVQSR